jgi:hypothetical protein
MPSCGVLPLEKPKRKINRRQLAMELAAEVALATMSKASEVLRRFLQADNLNLPRHQTHKEEESYIH